MPKRININVDDDVPLKDAVEHVLRSMERGRISNSNTQYCYAVVNWRTGIVVEAGLTPSGADTFRVVRDRRIDTGETGQ